LAAHRGARARSGAPWRSAAKRAGVAVDFWVGTILGAIFEAPAFVSGLDAVVAATIGQGFDLQAKRVGRDDADRCGGLALARQHSQDYIAAGDASRGMTASDPKQTFMRHAGELGICIKKIVLRPGYVPTL
jgi:hypothetical protein